MKRVFTRTWKKISIKEKHYLCDKIRNVAKGMPTRWYRCEMKAQLCHLSVLESKNIQSIQGRNTEAEFVVCDGNKTLGGRIYHSSGSCLGMVNQFLKRCETVKGAFLGSFHNYKMIINQLRHSDGSECITPTLWSNSVSATCRSKHG